MGTGFDYFVVFAEMRTGSNFLETNLNAFPGLACYGEAFNPHFIGYPEQDSLLGVSRAARDTDPVALIDAIKADDALAGFRFFHDHDPRVVDICLNDARCAKIVLTRNPVESYVSWKIASTTGQWKLTNVTHAKSAEIAFDATEFNQHLEGLRSFQRKLLRGLQITGQTAFYLAYEDLQDVELINGLARYLGQADQLDALKKALKKQNPSPLHDKVSNYDEMVQALSGIDHFDLGRTPNFEPRRGPNIPTYIAAPQAPLLYLPVRAGPEAQIRRWLADLDGAPADAVLSSFTQKTLRQWKRQHPGHRSFTVLRHPAARAHVAFCNHVLGTGPGTFPALRRTLRKQFGLPIPEEAPDADYSVANHRAAFLAFLQFLKANLNGQTSVRVDPVWASQSHLIQGMAEFALPDLVLREDDLDEGLAWLAPQIGRAAPPLRKPRLTKPYSLSEIYNDEIEAAARDAYQKDYMLFGFGPWR